MVKIQAAITALAAAFGVKRPIAKEAYKPGATARKPREPKKQRDGVMTRVFQRYHDRLRHKLSDYCARKNQADRGFQRRKAAYPAIVAARSERRADRWLRSA